MEYKKILIEIHHGLGDIVQMIPLISNLRKNFGNSKISVIVASKVHAEILDCTGLVDSYYFLNLRQMTPKDIICLIREIRREKYDLGFLSPISNKRLGAILLYILGCKFRVGETEINNKFIIKNNITIQEDTRLHRVDRNLNLLNAANIKIHDYNPMMKVNEDNTVNAKRKLMHLNKNLKLLGICIGTNPVEQKKVFKINSYDAKKWSLGNYFQLIEKLTQKYNVILLGGKREEEEIKEFEGLIKNNNRVVNFINRTTIIESASIVNECDLIVGGDTGMLHIADALGKRTLTIFGPTDPSLVGPYSEKSSYISLGLDCQYCYGTERIFRCTDRKCLKGITVGSVYNKILEILHDKI